MITKTDTQFALQQVMELVRDPKNIYLIGSRARSYHSANDPFELVAITQAITLPEPIVHGNVKINVYSAPAFEQMLDRYDVMMMSLLSLPKKCVLRNELQYYVNLDVKKFKKAAVSQANAAWVLGRKALKSGKIAIGKRHIEQAFQILYFARQWVRYRYVQFYDRPGMNDMVHSYMYQSWWDFRRVFKPELKDKIREFKRASRET